MCLQDTLFRVELDKEQQPPKAAALQEPSKGTRSDPRFDLEHPEMKRFTAYLQSYDGETKQEQEARSITTDVSKFLKYASPDKVNWLAVTDPIKVRIPGEHGTKVGCRHRRQTDQIMSIKVTPIHLPRAATQQQELFHRCQLVAERYSKWWKVMNREKVSRANCDLRKPPRTQGSSPN